MKVVVWPAVENESYRRRECLKLLGERIWGVIWMESKEKNWENQNLSKETYKKLKKPKKEPKGHFKPFPEKIIRFAPSQSHKNQQKNHQLVKQKKSSKPQIEIKSLIKWLNQLS